MFWQIDRCQWSIYKDIIHDQTHTLNIIGVKSTGWEFENYLICASLCRHLTDVIVDLVEAITPHYWLYGHTSQQGPMLYLPIMSNPVGDLDMHVFVDNNYEWNICYDCSTHLVRSVNNNWKIFIWCLLADSLGR